MMKKELQALIILLVFSVSAISQVNRYGTPVISCFSAAETPGDLHNLSITMDKRGVMYFGNESGEIVTYDGTHWGIIPLLTHHAITALATDSKGIVYAGCDTDFGFLQPDKKGKIVYHSLSVKLNDSIERYNISTISSVSSDSNRVCFAGGKRLYILDCQTDSLSMINLESDYGLKSVRKVLVFNKRTILADNSEGLFEYSDGKVARLNGGEKIRMVNYVDLVAYDNDNILLATEENGLLLFNLKTGMLDTSVFNWHSERNYQTGHVTSMVLLPGSMVAAGMSEGGGVYVFSHDGQLLNKLSGSTTCLRESSVTAMYCDNTSKSQLWFCTSGFINRAYITLPAFEFGNSAGLMSASNGIEIFQDTVYVSTCNGIYKNYSDQEGVARFKKSGNTDGMVYELLSLKEEGKDILLAATANGLWQIDEEGSADRFLPGFNLTAIKQSGQNQSLILAASSDRTIRTLHYSKNSWDCTGKTVNELLKGVVKSIQQSEDNDWWILTLLPSELLRMECGPTDTVFVRYNREKGLDCDTLNNIVTIDSTLYVCTGKGIYRFDKLNDIFVKDHDLVGETFDDLLINTLFKTPDGDIFISGYSTRNFDALVSSTSQGHVVFRRQFDYLPDIATTDIACKEDKLWITKGSSIFVIDKSKLGFSYGTFSTFFTEITTGTDQVLMEGSFYTVSSDGTIIPSVSQSPDDKVILKYKSNISFWWTTTSYLGENKTEYIYKLDGLDKDWSKWERRTHRDYTNLSAGDYTFRLKSISITGLESEEVDYAFTVKKPWYFSFVALLFYLLAVTAVLYTVIRYYLRILKLRNNRLESLLKLRKEEDEKRKESIVTLEKYAGAIQKILMPPIKNITNTLANSFTLYKPKKATGGDFYWVSEKNNRFLIAAGDCTGEGVTAMMRTVAGISFLDMIIKDQADLKTSEIISEFQSKVAGARSALYGPEEKNESINIAVIAIDHEMMTIEFSGAGVRCFRVRELTDDEKGRQKAGNLITDKGMQYNKRFMIETVYGDKVVKGMSSKQGMSVTQYEWQLESNTSYYLFTDGYCDQFNGITGKKFLMKNLGKLILDIQTYPMNKQKEFLEDRLSTWMGSSPQTDDILIIGFKIE